VVRQWGAQDAGRSGGNELTLLTEKLLHPLIRNHSGRVGINRLRLDKPVKLLLVAQKKACLVWITKSAENGFKITPTSVFSVFFFCPI
jgi:hypothetical protein